MQKLNNPRDEHVFFNVWRVEDKIMFKNSDNGKLKLCLSWSNAKDLWKRKLNYCLSLLFM